MASQTYAQFAKTVSNITGKTYTEKDVSNAAAKIASSSSGSSNSSSSSSSATKPLANGGTMTLDQFGAFVNQQGIATPNWSPTTGLSAAGQQILSQYNTPINTNQMTALSGVGQKMTPAPTPDYLNNFGVGVDASVKATEQSLAQQRKDAETQEKDILRQYMQEQPERLEVPQELQKAKEQAMIQANQYKSQIDMINAQLQANLMQLRQTGSQEGVTEAVYGGQQNQLNREAAVKLMPLAALYQASLDNYQAAKEIVDDYIRQENQYLDRYWSWKNNLYDKAFQYADKREQRAVEDTRRAEDQAISAQKEANNLKRDIISRYLDNGRTPPKSLLEYDVNNPNSMNDLMSYAGNAPVATKAGVGGDMISPIAGVDSSYYNAFNSVVIGLAQGQRALATQTFNSYVQSGDLKSAKDYIVRLATVNMGEEQRSQAIGRAQATDALKDIKSLIEQARDAGAGTNLVSGSIENVANKLGLSNNPNLSLIGNQIQQALQTYRKGMTGVAFSPAEAIEYAKIFPDITNISSLNTIKVDSLLQSFDRNNRAALEFYIGRGNYEALFGEKKGMVLPGGNNQVILNNANVTGEDESVFDQVVGLTNNSSGSWFSNLTKWLGFTK